MESAEIMYADALGPVEYTSSGQLYTTTIPYKETVREYFETDIPEDSTTVETYPLEIPVEETIAKTYDVKLPPAGSSVTYGQLLLPVTKTVNVSYDFEDVPADEPRTDEAEVTIPMIETLKTSYDFQLPEDETVIKTNVYTTPITETVVQTITYSVDLPPDPEPREIVLVGKQYKTYGYDYQLPQSETEVTKEEVVVDVKEVVNKAYEYDLPTETPVSTKSFVLPASEVVKTSLDYQVPTDAPTPLPPPIGQKVTLAKETFGEPKISKSEYTYKLGGNLYHQRLDADVSEVDLADSTSDDLNASFEDDNLSLNAVCCEDFDYADGFQDCFENCGLAADFEDAIDADMIRLL